MKNTFEFGMNLAQMASSLNDLENLMKGFEGHVIGLTPKERRHLNNLQDGNLAFVQKAVETAQEHPEFVPEYINVDEYQERYEQHLAMLKLMRALEAFQLTLSDTSLKLGDRVMEESFRVYNLVKIAHEADQPGAKGRYQQLRSRFRSGSGESNGGNDSNENSDNDQSGTEEAG